MPDAATRIARRLGGPDARRRRHRRVGLALGLVAVVAIVLVVAGSGDGDGDGATGEAAATTAPAGGPLVEACRASNREIATAQRALLGGNDSPGAVEGFLADAFVDLTRDRSASLRALEPGAEVLAVLDDQDTVVDAIAADPAAAAASPDNPFDAVNERWRALGLGDCAIDSTTVTLDG